MVELLVVLVVLGVMAGIVGLAWQPNRWAEPNSDASNAGTIAAARRRAVESGAPVAVAVRISERPRRVLALPDGRVIGAEMAGFDPLSGVPTVQADTSDA